MVHKKFNKRVISETEWRYEAWFASADDYYVVENVPAGYLMRCENAGLHAEETERCYNGGTILNYKLPKTGDESHPAFWLLLAMTGAAGVIILAGRKKER